MSGLADLGKQYLEGFQTALEMFNNDDSLAVDFLGVEHDSGEKPSQTCQDIASTFVKTGVVAVIGGYRSICSMKAADILGTDNTECFTKQYASLPNNLELTEPSTGYNFLFSCYSGLSGNMIPQISYASTSSKLSEVSYTYKYFFRTAPSNADQALAIVAFIKTYKWKKVRVFWYDRME